MKKPGVRGQKSKSGEGEKGRNGENYSPLPLFLASFFVFTAAYCLLFTAHCLAQDGLKESLSDLNRIIPSKKIVNVPWGRDPFVPLTGDGGGKPANIKLTAIIYNAKKPSAIVNNKIIYIGDSVDGQKVIDITKQYVILRGIGGAYKLEIGNTAGQVYDSKKSQ